MADLADCVQKMCAQKMCRELYEAGSWETCCFSKGYERGNERCKGLILRELGEKVSKICYRA
jgi:hypothetical protein